MADFGARFKELRDSMGLTQDEIAKKLKTSRSRIGMYETGKRQPDHETLEEIADFFNVDIDYLLGRSDKTTVLPIASGLSSQEELLLKKYRDLDAHGKDMVDTVVDTVAEKEHERCSKEHLLPLAAHHESDRYSDMQKDKIKDRIREISDSE